MYPQFVDGNSMRGVPEPSRSPARQPFMNYYGPKVPDGMHYGGMPPVPRPPNPYSGKPDMMYHRGHPGWNPMMMQQNYGVSKPPMHKPDFQFTGQEHMYNRMYSPDPLSYGMGFPPGQQQFQPHYPGPPSHHFPPMGGDGFHDSFNTNAAPVPPPQQNDQWTRQQQSQQPPTPQQTQQQPSVVINDVGGVSDSGSPIPRTSVAWPSGDLLTPDAPNKPPRPAHSPISSPGLRKESSVSSLKEALLSGSQQLYEGKGNSVAPPPPNKAPTPSGLISNSNLGLSPGISQSPTCNLGPSPGPPPVGGVNYQGNSFLGISEIRDKSSPMTPNMGMLSGPTQTPPHIPSPSGLVSGNEGAESPMLNQSQPTPPTDIHSNRNSFDSTTPSNPAPSHPLPSSTAINRQPSPFEMDKILGLKENETQNGKTASPSLNNDPVASPSSSMSGSSPRSRKARMSPTVLSPIDRFHSSISNQYTLSKEPGRKEFLDALLDYLQKEGIALLKVPTVCKTQLDLYKSFTSVQQLGGFRHVVQKQLWKEVLRSFNPYSANSTPPALRLLQEYYVKVLLPYECNISNTSLQECLALYETKEHSPTVNNNLHEMGGGGDMVNNKASGGQDQQPLPSAANNDPLIPFSEDSQNSLDGISNQPLPDISVQEAEFVLGIPPTTNQGTSSQSPFPPNANWSDFMSNQPPLPPPPPEDRTFPSPLTNPPPPQHPGMGGGDPSFMFPPYNDQFNDYRNHRVPMGHFMNRHPYMGGMPPHPSPHMDPGFTPPHYPSVGGPRPHAQDGQFNSMDWQWNQPRPRLPPPLPPHLQSMSFQIPHSSQSHVPSMPTQNSSRPSTPQSVPLDRASPHRPNSQSSGGLDPIKIQWQDQQHSSTAASSSTTTPTTTTASANKTMGGVMTPPPSQLQPQPQAPPPPVPPTVSKESSIGKEEPVQKPTVPTTTAPKVVPEQQMKVSKPSIVVQPPPPPVEMTEPVYRKRRLLTSDQCGQVEPWRVMMSLKSGLAPDSTWALDTLSILLHDDRTVGFFYLKHHHSLLNMLVDHLTVCLHEIFGDVFEILPKYIESNGFNEQGKPEPVKASSFKRSKADIQMGRTDLLSHIHTCFKMSHSEQESSENPKTAHPRTSPLLRNESDTQHGPQPKVCRIDETPLNSLLKRDALGERILFHLKTPRRVMVCSPIQKFFPSNDQLPNTIPIEENEIFKPEAPPTMDLSEQRESLIRRCLTLSNIIRSLSFIPGNDVEFSQHTSLLVILGKILLFCHTHLPKPPSPSSLLRKNSDSDNKKPKPSLLAQDETETFWWWDCLEVLRENVFVILANIAGQLDLSIYPEAINYPLIDGLLHWLVCPSSAASDPLPESAVASSLSPQRLVLEALAKISISEVNVDYILATPTLSRLDLVYDTLLQFISQRRHPASKQFALVFLSNLAQGDEGASRMIGQQKMAIPLLMECLESAESSPPHLVSKSGRSVYNHPPGDDPTSLSIAMLRRTAITLHCLARVHLNRVSFLPYCNRLLSLVMSSTFDSSLTSILSDVLFELNRIV